MLYRLFFLVLFSFFSFNSMAAYGGSSKIGTITVNQFEWTTTDGGVKVLKSKAAATFQGDSPWCGDRFSTCGVALMASSSSMNTGYFIFSSGAGSTYTADQAAAAINSIEGRKFQSSLFSPTLLGKATSVCVYKYEKSSSQVGYELIPGSCSGGGIPPVPPTVTCAISGDVNIDYGSVTTDNLSGLHKTGTTSVSCDQDAVVNLRVYNIKDNSNVVSLRDDGSLSSKLTVDGKDTSTDGTNIDLKANIPTNVTIDSELVVSGTPEAGDFNGSALAVITIP